MEPTSPLRITFPNSLEFAREYDRNLTNHGIFVPTLDLRAVRDVVDFVVVVPYNGKEIQGKGEVIYVVDDAHAAKLGGQPGLGLQVHEFDMETAAKARKVIQETLVEAALEPPEQRRALRVPARLRVRFKMREGFEAGMTRDISVSGVHLFAREPASIGTSVELVLVRPLDGHELRLEGEVARTPLLTESDGPSIGLGVRFLYLTETARSQMDRFVRYVDLKRRALTAQLLRGHIRETGVESVLHLFCMLHRDGELILRRSDEAGRIVFKESTVVHAEIPRRGLTGERAFYRMLTWHDGEFEFHAGGVTSAREIDLPGIRLFHEGLRHRAEVEAWARRMPPERRVLPGPAMDPTADTFPESARPLLDILDQRPTVWAALDCLGDSDLEAFRILDRLRSGGVLRLAKSLPSRP